MTHSPHTPREGDVRTTSQLSGERIGWAEWKMKISHDKVTNRLHDKVDPTYGYQPAKRGKPPAKRWGNDNDTTTQQGPFRDPAVTKKKNAVKNIR